MPQKEHGAWRLRRDRRHLDVPGETVVRILVVLSIFLWAQRFFYRSGLYRSVFVLDPMPDNLAAGKPQPTSGELLGYTVDRGSFAAGESVAKWNATSRRIRSHCVSRFRQHCK